LARALGCLMLNGIRELLRTVRGQNLQPESEEKNCGCCSL
jgi:hypothetical protein